MPVSFFSTTNNAMTSPIVLQSGTCLSQVSLAQKSIHFRFLSIPSP